MGLMDNLKEKIEGVAEKTKGFIDSCCKRFKPREKQDDPYDW